MFLCLICCFGFGFGTRTPLVHVLFRGWSDPVCDPLFVFLFSRPPRFFVSGFLARYRKPAGGCLYPARPSLLLLYWFRCERSPGRRGLWPPTPCPLQHQTRNDCVEKEWLTLDTIATQTQCISRWKSQTSRLSYSCADVHLFLAVPFPKRRAPAQAPTETTASFSPPRCYSVWTVKKTTTKWPPSLYHLLFNG